MSNSSVNNDNINNNNGLLKEENKDDVEQDQLSSSGSFHAQEIWSPCKDNSVKNKKDTIINTKSPKDEESTTLMIDKPKSNADDESTSVNQSTTPNKIWTAEESSKKGGEGEV